MKVIHKRKWDIPVIFYHSLYTRCGIYRLPHAIATGRGWEQVTCKLCLRKRGKAS